MPYEAAAQMERELAEDLRAEGYTVTGRDLAPVTRPDGSLCSRQVASRKRLREGFGGPSGHLRLPL